MSVRRFRLEDRFGLESHDCHKLAETRARACPTACGLFAVQFNRAQFLI